MAFRAVLRTGPLAPRLAVAVVAVPTVVIGLEVSSEVQIAALTLVVVAGILAEERRRQPLPRS